MQKKLTQVFNILEKLSEIYPELEKVMINDPSNPDYIIICTEDYLKSLSKKYFIGEDEDRESGDLEKKVQ